MQHQCHADAGTQVLGVCPDETQCFGRGLEQQTIALTLKNPDPVMLKINDPLAAHVLIAG